jgi:hypothetical protein
MKTLRNKIIICALSAAWIVSTSACGGGGGQPAIDDRAAASDLPSAAPLASGDKATEQAIRFLEERVKSDPEDFSASGKLANLYLQRLRETGNAQYLELAFRAARASLDSVPEVRNAGGLAARLD